MRIHTVCCKLIRAAAFCLLAALFCVQPALALPVIDTGAARSLTVEYRAGAPVELYRVADLSPYGVFTWAAPFDELSLADPNGLDIEAWTAMTSTLAAYAAQEEIAPARTGTVGRNGRLSWDDLDTGLWLLCAPRHTLDGVTCEGQPALVSLPMADLEADRWAYDVTVHVKYETTGDGMPDEETINRKVLKVWREADPAAAARPEFITVSLLRDGKVWKTVRLSEENGWKYHFGSLDARYTWQVIEEDVPDGYTVTVEQNGITFVITNTAGGDLPPDIPDTPDTPDTPGTPGTPDTPDTPDAPDTPDGPQLPLTGMLQWPIPVLALAGMVLFALGWALERREDSRA